MSSGSGRLVSGGPTRECERCTAETNHGAIILTSFICHGCYPLWQTYRDRALLQGLTDFIADKPEEIADELKALGFAPGATPDG